MVGGIVQLEARFEYVFDLRHNSAWVEWVSAPTMARDRVDGVISAPHISTITSMTIGSSTKATTLPRSIKKIIVASGNK
jgi:hypothetical protein